MAGSIETPSDCDYTLELTLLNLPRLLSIRNKNNNNSDEASTSDKSPMIYYYPTTSWLTQLAQNGLYNSNMEDTNIAMIERIRNQRLEIVVRLCTIEGSQWFENKLKENDIASTNVILGIIYEKMAMFMTDEFGNHIFFRLIERSNLKELRLVLIKLTMYHEMFLNVLQNKHGANTVKRLIKKLTQSPQLVGIIISTLVTKLMPLMSNRISSHVILKCFECLDHHQNKELFETIISKCIELATHEKGCLALNESIKYFKQPHRDLLLDKISSSARHLSQDPSGNYAVSEVLGLCIPRFTKKICNSLRGCFVRLSMQRSASHVVEKCLESEIGITMVLHEFINHNQLWKIARDQCGNYVIQTLLNNAVKNEGYEELIIKLYADRNLYKFGYGMNLYNKIISIRGLE